MFTLQYDLIAVDEFKFGELELSTSGCRFFFRDIKVWRKAPNVDVAEASVGYIFRGSPSDCAERFSGIAVFFFVFDKSTC